MSQVRVSFFGYPSRENRWMSTEVFNAVCIPLGEQSSLYGQAFAHHHRMVDLGSLPATGRLPSWNPRRMALLLRTVGVGQQGDNSTDRNISSKEKALWSSLEGYWRVGQRIPVWGEHPSEHQGLGKPCGPVRWCLGASQDWGKCCGWLSRCKRWNNAPDVVESCTV